MSNCKKYCRQCVAEIVVHEINWYLHRPFCAMCINTGRPIRRWDEFIMTDSEPEHEVDENHCVAFAAESVAILAIGCVSGLRGLRKLRKGVKYNRYRGSFSH